MDVAIGKVLQNAIGVAISPIPIIAIILILLSKNSAKNGIAFAFGWVLILGVTAAVVLTASDAATSDNSSDGTSWVQIIIGALFLFFAVKQWMGRPKPGEKGSLPGWMESIESFTPIKALAIALVIGVTNIKNITLAIAASTALSTAGLSTSQEVWGMVIFVLIGTSSVVVPVIVVAVAGDRANHVLNEMREWLQHNNHTVMSLLFLLLGVSMLAKGLGG